MPARSPGCDPSGGWAQYNRGKEIAARLKSLYGEWGESYLPTEEQRVARLKKARTQLARHKRNQGKYSRNPISRADIEDLGRAYIEGEDIAHSPEAKAMAREQAARVHREFDKLRQHIRIEFTDRDPYASFEELIADVQGNQRMKVYTGSSETPLWDERTNWMARAVHDWDHVQAMVDFSLPGELAAYRAAASRAPALSPLYLSEIALQAASYHVLGGAFAPGPQKLVRAPERIARRAAELRSNPVEGGEASPRVRVRADDVLLASTLLSFMSEAEVMTHLAAKGMGKTDVAIATEGAVEMLRPEELLR